MGSCCETDRSSDLLAQETDSLLTQTQAPPSSSRPEPCTHHIRRGQSTTKPGQSKSPRKQFQRSSVGQKSIKTGHLHGREVAVSSPELILMKLQMPIKTLFALNKELHRDLNATVYLAKHLQTGKERVVKQVKKNKRANCTDANSEERLRGEVEMLSGLDHPNILKLYELYEDKLYFYLVSEALTGGYLMDYLTMGRNLSEPLAAKIIVQVMKALNYCHSREVIHGNLRMDSLILQSTPTDDNVHVIITGFGSTSLLSLKESLSTKIGSALFIAPETLQYEPSEKADVWSCGVILHMLLCGNPPFNGPTTDSILEQIASESVTFPQELWEGVSSEAINLLRGMLNKDSATRISFTECLNHPWLQANSKCTNSDSKPIFRALRNLKVFEAKKKLKQTILSFMAARIDTQEETKSLRDAFISVDTNGDGFLSKEELISAYAQLMTRDEAVFVAEKVMRCVDLDQNGFIDYSEFMLAAKNHKLLMTSRNLRCIFTQFDRDSSGKISFNEFKETLHGQKLQADDGMWAELLAAVDSDGDGELDFQEFSRLMLAAVDMDGGRVRR